MRAAKRPPGTLQTAKAMKTKNGIKAATTGLLETWLDSGPIASATPMSRKARNIGSVFNFIVCSFYTLFQVASSFVGFRRAH